MFESISTINKLNKKKNHNSGAALIVAVIIIAILIIFTFSLMLITYTLYASQNKKIASMKCSEAANTLSLAIEEELTHDNSVNDFTDCPEINSNLYKYLRYNLYREETWPYYLESNPPGHEKKDAYRYFRLRYNEDKDVYNQSKEEMTVEDDDGNVTPVRTSSGIKGYPGRTEICMYWMPPKDYKEENINSIEDFEVEGIRLVVIVTCESASQSYSVEREYELMLGNYEDEFDQRYVKLKSVTGSIKDMVNPGNLELKGSERWIWKKITK